MTPDTLRLRQERLRLSIRDLARLANTHQDSIHRLFKGKTDARLSTLQKVDAALTAEEKRLREQLGDAPAVPS